MTKQEKLQEVKEQIDTMTKDIKETLCQMTREALSSGALSEEMKKTDNYLLAKAVWDVWCQKRPYAPLSPKTKKGR